MVVRFFPECIFITSSTCVIDEKEGDKKTAHFPGGSERIRSTIYEALCLMRVRGDFQVTNNQKRNYLHSDCKSREHLHYISMQMIRICNCIKLADLQLYDHKKS